MDPKEPQLNRVKSFSWNTVAKCSWDVGIVDFFKISIKYRSLESDFSNFVMKIF